jgi:hypothetical protein
VVNDFGNGKIEVVVYKKNFAWLKDYENYQLAMQKNFLPYDDPVYGRVLLPLNDEARISKLLETLDDTSKRAQDTFYGYALANHWKYFFTFTFDPAKVDRYDDTAVVDLWALFARRLRHHDKKVKILCIKERHADGALHFHGLIDTERDFVLKPHYENGVWKRSKNGDPLFEFDMWDYGMHTLVVLDKDTNQDRVVNYLITYVTKQGNTGFGKRRFFRTHNLKYKFSYVAENGAEQGLIADNGLRLYKDADGLTVWRNFNIKEDNALDK